MLSQSEEGRQVQVGLTEPSLLRPQGPSWHLLVCDPQASPLTALLPPPWSPFIDLKTPRSRLVFTAVPWALLSQWRREAEAESPWFFSKTSQASSLSL